MDATRTIIRTAFPEHPVPTTFFMPARDGPQDLPEELAARIEGRAWTSVSLRDWRMVGSTPAAYRAYVVPRTFAYYVPSLFVGVISEPEFRDLALEAILPNNRLRSPRGEWWTNFVASFEEPQRAAISAFLAFVRNAAAARFEQIDEDLSAAEAIWS